MYNLLIERKNKKKNSYLPVHKLKIYGLNNKRHLIYKRHIKTIKY